QLDMAQKTDALSITHSGGTGDGEVRLIEPARSAPCAGGNSRRFDFAGYALISHGAGFRLTE
ncbi:MAG: hypothetical protein JJ992_15775, partial [Planctomycetes bacterium]|nr:hypothetical protein [Planctomycetota bacterium]